jgi:hypothetical protein
MPILIKRADGGVSFMHLVGNADAATEVARYIAATGHTVASYETIDAAAIPPKDEYRNALGHDLKHDMGRARDIQKEIAAERKLLAEREKAKRDALAAVGADPRLAAAKTIAELKSVLPL